MKRNQEDLFNLATNADCDHKDNGDESLSFAISSRITSYEFGEKAPGEVTRTDHDDSLDLEAGEVLPGNSETTHFRSLHSFMKEGRPIETEDSSQEEDIFDATSGTQKSDFNERSNLKEIIKEEQEATFEIEIPMNKLSPELMKCPSKKAIESSTNFSASTNATSTDSQRQVSSEEEEEMKGEPIQKRDPHQPLPDDEIHKTRRIEENKEIRIPLNSLQAFHPIHEVLPQPRFRLGSNSLCHYSASLLRKGYNLALVPSQIWLGFLKGSQQMNHLLYVAGEIERVRNTPCSLSSLFSSDPDFGPIELLEPRGLGGLFKALIKIQKLFNIDNSILDAAVHHKDFMNCIHRWNRASGSDNDRQKQVGVILIAILAIAQQVLQVDQNSEEKLQTSSLFMEFFIKMRGNQRASLTFADCREDLSENIQKGLLAVMKKMKTMLKFGKQEQSKEEKSQFDALAEVHDVISYTKGLETLSQFLVEMELK